MNIYLWLNNEQKGPFTAEMLKASVASKQMSPNQTACIEGGTEWKLLCQLIDLSNPPVAAEPPPQKETKVAAPEVIEEYNIDRRSGWSGGLNGLGLFCIFLFFMGIVFSKQFGPTLLIVGAAGALQCFFFAFLINVFTDIRWFLKKIAENQSQD
jgi:hypothetical protein